MSDEIEQLKADKAAISETAAHYLHEIERHKADNLRLQGVIENLRHAHDSHRDHNVKLAKQVVDHPNEMNALRDKLYAAEQEAMLLREENNRLKMAKASNVLER